ncbi:MAG: nicotinate-nucleotide adenylyltransferase [Fimbriimonadales bacterium]|nr:nicotinate-nucleotide adenylyltransferase [Fimbriimonadales bacterium]
MKTGILGGTFDPPHMGHVSLAEAAMEHLGLEEVLFVPANRSPFKRHRQQSPARQRLEMLELLLSDRPQFAVCDIEVQRGGVSYTIETLTDLSFARPSDYWLLMGSDSLQSLRQWKNPEKIVRIARLGVALRDFHSQEELLALLPKEIAEKVDFLPMKPVAISSTELRERAAKGHSLLPWVTPELQRYIQENRLYR